MQLKQALNETPKLPGFALSYHGHRRPIHCLLLMLCLATLQPLAYGKNILSWTGNGGDSLWTDSKNWSPHGVPGIGGTNDAAIIDQQGSNFVILDTNLVIGDISVGGSQGTNILELGGVSIQCSDSVLIATNGAFEIQGSSSVSGGGFQNSGTILVPDNLGTLSLTMGCNFTNNGTVAAGTNSILSLPDVENITPQFLDGTAFDGPGTVLFPSGNGFINCIGAITINGRVEMQQSVAGTSTWAGPGLFRWDAGGINNLTFGTNLNVEIAGAASKFVSGTCSNEGTIRWLAGASGFTNSDIGTFYNTGLFQIEGDCQLGVGINGLQILNFGSITAASNVGTVSLTIDCALDNYGTIGAGTNSTLDILVLTTGPVVFSSIVFKGPGLIRFPAGSVPFYWIGSITDNGTVELYSDFGLGSGNIWSGPGLLRWLSGSLNNATFSPGFHVDIGGGGTKSISGTCTNEGTIRWMAGAGGFTNASNNGQFYNSGLFEIDDNGALGQGLSSFQSSGTIDIPSGLGELSLAISCGFTNSGLIDVETNSALDIVTPSFNSPVPEFGSGTDFAGPGTVRFPPASGPVSWSGAITVNGLLEIDTYCPPGSNSLWFGPGLLLMNGGLYNATFEPGFNVELGTNYSTGLSGDCTNLGTIRCLTENPFGGDPRATLQFYNFGLFQIETNCSFTSPVGSFQNIGTIRIPAGYGELSLTTDDALTNSGTIDVETNSALDITANGAPVLFESGTLFSGPGTIEFDPPGGISCNGQITANGPVIFNTFQSGNVIWTGPGPLRFLAGGMENATFGPGFHVQMVGSDFKAMDGICTNQGTICYLSTGGLGADPEPFSANQFYNSGLFQIETNFDLTQYSPFQNTGTITVPAKFGELTLEINSCYFTNFGVIDVETNSELAISNSFDGSQTYLDGTMFNGAGTVLFATDGTGTFDCTGAMTVNGTVQFDQLTVIGQSTWSGSGLLRWLGGEIQNFTFGTNFHAQFTGQEEMFPYGNCTNEGTVYWSGGGLEPDFSPVSNGGFYNYGTLQASGNCAFQAGSTPLPIGNVQNFGLITVPAGLGSNSLLVNCNFTNYGTIDVETNSELTISNGPYGSQTYFGGTIFGGPGTIDFAADQSAGISCNGAMTAQGTIDLEQNISGSSVWNGPGLLQWLGGSVSAITFAPNFNVQISGDNPKFFSVCTNQGTIRWLGGGAINNSPLSGQFYNSGVLQIETNGTWDRTPIINEPSGIFRQLAGEFSVDSITNCGTVDLQNGKLDVAENFFSGSNSVYQITLSGNTPGTNYNQLAAQALALNGSLKVVLTNGFLPVSGNSFVIANDSSQSGTFSNLTVPTFQSNLVMNVRYSPGSVTLEVETVFFGLTNSVYTNGTFQFSLNGPPSSAYDIQASSNLIDWITIGTNSPFTGSLNFTDTNASTWGRRFYRARIYP